MLFFRKTWRALLSYYLRFEICLFVLLSTLYELIRSYGYSIALYFLINNCLQISILNIKRI